MKDNDLLPCPFCGAPPYIEKPSHDRYGWAIVCGFCRAQTEPVHIKAKAVERWNMRNGDRQGFGFDS